MTPATLTQAQVRALTYFTSGAWLRVPAAAVRTDTRRILIKKGLVEGDRHGVVGMLFRRTPLGLAVLAALDKGAKP